MEISCPVSEQRINENIARLIAFVVALIGISCLVLDNYWAIIFLMVDFATRSFTPGKQSLLKLVSLQIAKLIKLPSKMTDLAPKKFAATVGFAFCTVISLLLFLDFPTVVFGLTSILVIFALLESVFAICVGCYVYSFLQSFKRKN